MGKCLNVRIHGKLLKTFTQKCSNDLEFLSQGQICYLGFYMGRVHGLSRSFGLKVNKNSKICELCTSCSGLCNP